MSALKQIIVERQLNATILTLNRPQKYNALTLDMVRSLHSHFEQPGIKILQSTHPKAFCAGGDVVNLLEDELRSQNFFMEEYRMNLALHNRKHQKDTIAILNGICFGGGVGISAHAPYVIVTENIKFGMPETKIGAHPDIGWTFIAPRLSPGVGLLLGLTGRIINSPWLLKEIGCASHFVPSKSIPSLINEICNIAEPNQIPNILNSISAQPEPMAGDYKLLEIANDCFNNHSLEEIFESLKEKPNCELCKELLTSLQYASPLALHVTLKLYNLKPSTLEESLRIEYRVSSRMVRKGTDVHVGVPKLLIEKSEGPVKWLHESIYNVPVAAIDAFFKPLEVEWTP